jgi:hypothetical protein
MLSNAYASDQLFSVHQVITILLEKLSIENSIFIASFQKLDSDHVDRVITLENGFVFAYCQVVGDVIVIHWGDAWSKITLSIIHVPIFQTKSCIVTKNCSCH